MDSCVAGPGEGVAGEFLGASLVRTVLDDQHLEGERVSLCSRAVSGWVIAIAHDVHGPFANAARAVTTASRVPAEPNSLTGEPSRREHLKGLEADACCAALIPALSRVASGRLACMAPSFHHRRV